MIPLHSELCVRGVINCRSANLRRIVRGYPLAIVAASHVFHPRLVLKIPAHRLANSGFKSFTWPPAKLPFDLARVHRITAIVTRTVFYKSNQFAARRGAL